MDIVDVADLDVIFLTYDEPKKEEFWIKIQNIAPWAKRVDGVKGSDNAHKAAGEASDTDRFVLIDGDNLPDPDFFNIQLELDDKNKDCVFRWRARNEINGLMYGNGGLKCWPKDYVLNMRTHENADPDNPHAQVDFCWDLQYIQQNGWYSTVHNNATPQQAWRAGFREGVKMALDQGVKPTKEEFLKGHWKNLHRLWIWLMIGSDVENGMWAIYGARQGLYMTMCTDWDYVNVRDFEYLNNMWEQEKHKEDGLLIQIQALGNDLINELQIPIDANPLLPNQSKFFKTVYQNPSRNPKQQFIIDPE